MAHPHQVPPVRPEEYDEIRRLHAAGHGRNEIARRMGRSTRWISATAAHLGLSFDRTATQEALKARLADLAERRQLLAEELQGDAEKLSAQMWEPAKIYNFGGKDNTYEERDVSEPPPVEKRALMGAAGLAIEKSLKLLPPATQSGEDDAKSMLGKMMAGLQQVWDEQQNTGGDESGDAP